MLIKESLRKANVDIVMLQETKLEVVDHKWIRSIWGCRNKNWSFLPSLGASGGQLIIWRDELFKNVESLPGAYTHSIKFKKKDDGVMWVLTLVYGLVRPSKRKAFWLELSDIHALWDIPLCGR